MRDEIISLCRCIEAEYDVTILFAVENGSRAWRMASKDSDYDVRFVFVRKLDEYISLTQKPDVIEKMDGDLDLVGFDVYKFLGLLSKSNPTMIEWLFSDIVYVGTQPSALRNWAESESNWLALYHHYRSLCKNNYVKYIQSGNRITGKKYLYVFRGLINAKFVELYQKIPPIQFGMALAAVNLSPQVLAQLNQLLELKRRGWESDVISTNEVFDGVVDEFLNTETTLSRFRSDTMSLDRYIQELLL